jgi:hypothetical protein
LRSAARALEHAGAVEVRKAAVATTPAIVTRQQTGATRARRRAASRTVVHGPWAA